MDSITQSEISGLLEQAGARAPRYGRGKWTCPNHLGPATVSVDEAKGLFNCHRAGCDFHGGIGALRKRLGIEREWLPRAEYVRQRRACQQAEAKARQFLEACRMERLKAYEELYELARIEALAHDAGLHHPATWDALALVYSQRPTLTATAALLSEGAIHDRRHWLEASPEERERIVDEILLTGGLHDSAGKFVEVGA